MNDPDWLLTGEPRAVQVEALRRSYQGRAVFSNADGSRDERLLAHYPRPAVGWPHFMEMRLGKTAVALNEYMLFKRDHGLPRMLVLSPNSFKEGWRNDALKFGIDVPVHVFQSTKRKEAEAFVEKTHEGVIVVNYEALTSKATVDLLEKWMEKQCYFAADESVRIKNPKAVSTKRCLELSKSAAVVRPLTGLPSPQGVTDLWAQLRFARRLNGVNFFQFRARFAKMGGYMHKKVVGIVNEDKLRELMDENTFVASRKDWGGYLPPDFDAIKLKMLPAQAEAYSAMEKDFVLWLQNGGVASADQVLAKYIKLQQISSGFVRDDLGHDVDIVPFDKTPKFIDLKDRLDNFINGKTLIVAKYNSTIDRLYTHLAEYEPAVIRGSVHMKELGRDVDAEKLRFNTDPNCRIMIAQISAIKYGHTLMGTPTDPCSTVVFFENSYSLDDRAQTEQRPQGFGQTTAAYIVDYASTGVEAEVIEALQHKQAVSDVVLGHYKGETGGDI